MYQTNFLLSYYLRRFPHHNRIVLRVLHPQSCVSVAHVEGEGALLIITSIIITPDSTAELEELGMM